MKKLIYSFILFCCSSFGLFAQFVEFHSTQSNWTPPAYVPLPGKNQVIEEPTRKSTPSIEKTSTTGYVLNESGNVKSKIQLKISIDDNGNSNITSYYKINSAVGGGSWVNQNTIITVHEQSGLVPISKMEQVAYSNYTNWANWSPMGKNWFNL